MNILIPILFFLAVLSIIFILPLCLVIGFKQTYRYIFAIPPVRGGYYRLSTDDEPNCFVREVKDGMVYYSFVWKESELDDNFGFGGVTARQLGYTPYKALGKVRTESIRAFNFTQFPVYRKAPDIEKMSSK